MEESPLARVFRNWYLANRITSDSGRRLISDGERDRKGKIFIQSASLCSYILALSLPFPYYIHNIYNLLYLQRTDRSKAFHLGPPAFVLARVLRTFS